jgi:hypothetical protein
MIKRVRVSRAIQRWNKNKKKEIDYIQMWDKMKEESVEEHK